MNGVHHPLLGRLLGSGGSFQVDGDAVVDGFDLVEQLRQHRGHGPLLELRQSLQE
jgi:hypothetical protein